MVKDLSSCVINGIDGILYRGFSERFGTKFINSTVYNNLKCNMMSLLYYFLSLIRKVILNICFLTISYLNESPDRSKRGFYLVIIIVLVNEIAWLMYLIKVKPFARKTLNRIEIMNHICFIKSLGVVFYFVISYNKQGFSSYAIYFGLIYVTVMLFPMSYVFTLFDILYRNIFIKIILPKLKTIKLRSPIYFDSKFTSENEYSSEKSGLLASGFDLTYIDS